MRSLENDAEMSEESNTSISQSAIDDQKKPEALNKTVLSESAASKSQNQSKSKQPKKKNAKGKEKRKIIGDNKNSLKRRSLIEAEVSFTNPAISNSLHLSTFD